MDKVTIRNPDIDVRFVIDGVDYHIGKNASPEFYGTYAWNIYRTTDQKYYIGQLVLDRHVKKNNGGRMVDVSVWKDKKVNKVYECKISVGLLKDKEILIGVAKGSISMNQI
jgi:hypothetical protein